jgi:glycosyltransferase involved in cell wall biosynthesis
MMDIESCPTKARERGLYSNLHFQSEVSEDDKVRLYNSADVYVLPTRNEGFGLPLLEAMAAGCLVVSTNIPVVDEIVRDGRMASSSR